MKILFVTNIYPPHVRGGYELGCQSIAHAIANLGHEVCVATSRSLGYLCKTSIDTAIRVETCFEPIFGYEEKISEQLDQKSAWLAQRRQAFGGTIPANALALQKLLLEFKPDVVWLFNPLGLGPVGIMEGVLTWPARRLIHLMDDVDGVIRDHSPEVFYLGRLAGLKKHFSAISCSYKTMAENEVQGSYRSHRVIYNAIDFASLPSATERPSSTSGVPKLVYFGQVAEVKGLLAIVAGAKWAYSQGLRFEIDIIGRASDTFEDELRKAVSMAGLNDVVHCLGFRKKEELMNVLPTYSAAILLLSIREPFAYSVVEAVGCGLPVIVTNGHGAAECFPTDYPLFVADRSNCEEVGSKIGWLINHKAAAEMSASKSLNAFKNQCDLHSVILPSYLRTIRSCPLDAQQYNLECALATWKTGELFSLAQ